MQLKIKLKDGVNTGRDVEIFVESEGNKFLIPVTNLSVDFNIEDLITQEIQMLMKFSAEEGAFVLDLIPQEEEEIDPNDLPF